MSLVVRVSGKDCDWLVDERHGVVVVVAAVGGILAVVVSVVVVFVVSGMLVATVSVVVVVVEAGGMLVAIALLVSGVPVPTPMVVDVVASAFICSPLATIVVDKEAAL